MFVPSCKKLKKSHFTLYHDLYDQVMYYIKCEHWATCKAGAAPAVKFSKTSRWTFASKQCLPNMSLQEIWIIIIIDRCKSSSFSSHSSSLPPFNGWSRGWWWRWRWRTGWPGSWWCSWWRWWLQIWRSWLWRISDGTMVKMKVVTANMTMIMREGLKKDD